MNLANQPTVAKAVVEGTEYRQVEGRNLCLGCDAEFNYHLCHRLPDCVVPTEGTASLIWLKIA